MKFARAYVLGLSLVVLLMAASPSVFAEAARVRWDIIVLTPPATVNAGGQASALNNIGDKITLTGTGTFVAPWGGERGERGGRGRGRSDAVTGGGTWTIVTAGGSSTGTYIVTGLVRWEEAPGT